MLQTILRHLCLQCSSKPWNYRNQLSNDTSYIGLTTYGISLPTKNFGTRNIPVGFNGGLNPADFAYGLLSSAYAEVESVTLNEGLVVQVYSRFRIDGDITDGPYTMNETVAKQGAPSITGVVYGSMRMLTSSILMFVLLQVLGQPQILLVQLLYYCQISAIETRVHIINLKGDFVADIPFKGYTSGATAQPTSFLKAEAAVTDNTGGKLTVILHHYSEHLRKPQLFILLLLTVHHSFQVCRT